MCDVVSKTLLKKPIVFQKTHCFQTCALFYPIVLKRKFITGHTLTYSKIHDQLYGDEYVNKDS